MPEDMGGIGLQLGDLGDGRALGGVDLDSCRDSGGLFEPWALEVMDLIGSYTEISPSGTGAKIFFLYETSELLHLRKSAQIKHGKAWKRGSGEHPPAIELHLSNRYFAVTEDCVPDTPPDLRARPCRRIAAADP